MAASAYYDTVQKIYIAYYGRPADPAGKEYWAGRLDAAGGNLNEIINAFGTSAEATSLFGAMNNLQKINAIYQQCFDRDAEYDGLVYYANQLAAGTMTQASIMLNILNGATGTDATAVANKLAVANLFTAAIDTAAELLAYAGDAAAATARTFLATVDSTAASVTTATAAVASTLAGIVAADGGVVGSTFTLTTGANTVTGTTGNDTIDGTTLDSWSAFDSINGGAGADTMTVLVSGTAVPGASTITNVETLNINTTGAGYTIDTTGYTGLTSLKLAAAGNAGATSVTAASTTSLNVVGATDTGAAGTSDVTIIGGGGTLTISASKAAAADDVIVGGTAVANAFTSASVTGGATIAITDRSGASAATGSTLTTVSLNGNTNAATVAANGLTTLNLTNNSQNATVTAAAGTRALTVNLDTATGGTITDATATTLNVNATGTASTGVTLSAGAATSVAIDAAKNLTVADVNIGAATSVTIAGAGLTTVSATTGVGVLTSINASSNTGGVTITPALATGVLYTGGTGADTITLGATTKAITTGAGNDVVTLSDGVAALGTGGSIDAGEGTDTLAFTTYANAVTASTTSTFAGTVSGFEKLKLVGANGAAGAVINLANLDNIKDVEIAGNRTATTTINNLLSGGTVTFSVDQTNIQALTVAVKDAATGTADVANIGLKGTAAVGSNAITVNSVETINFVTDDTATTITNITHTSSLTADSVTAIKVSGDAGLNLTYTGTTATNFDASGVTGGAVTWTSGALAAAATVTGSATRANTIDLSASSKAMTYTGGSGVDTITTGAGNDTITTAAGNDVISAGAGNNTITAGDGNDTVTVTTGSNTIDAGAGNDTINIGASAGLNTVNVGSGTDTVVLGGIQTAAGYYTSVTGMAAGDMINFAAVTENASTDGTLGAKITLGGASSFANYLDAATATQIADAGAALIKWFQFGGNTYVVVDNTKAADTPDDNVTFQDGIDSVIELVGLIDLTNSTTATDVLTIV